MSETEDVRELIENSETLTEFANKLEDSSIPDMPKSSGDYVSIESLKAAVSTLERKAKGVSKVEDLGNYNKKEFRVFTRKEGIRSKAKEIHNKMASN